MVKEVQRDGYPDLSRLGELPIKDGFRQRGMDMTRIETFTDAAFAFALTLLVLSSSPPTSIAALKEALRDIPVFIFGAANLMVFWHGHNEWSRRYGLDDFRTMLLSVALVSTILVYVYPLRFVGGLFVGFIRRLTGWPIGHEPTGDFAASDVNAAFVIYGVGFVANGIVLILLNLHAWRNREALRLNADEQFMTRSEIGAWTILCAVGVVSIVVGLVMKRLPGSPGMAYMLLPILMPIYGGIMSRKRRSLHDPSHADVLEVLGAKK
jgi:hypothetical protein